MPFQKGQKKVAGREKGVSNKNTRIVKDVFAEVFSKLQKDKAANLEVWAKENPTDFYKLAAKLIPIQVGGDADNPFVIQWHEELTDEAKS